MTVSHLCLLTCKHQALAPLSDSARHTWASPMFGSALRQQPLLDVQWVAAWGSSGESGLSRSQAELPERGASLWGAAAVRDTDVLGAAVGIGSWRWLLIHG